jgi:N6-adenosine-specific RNA methylase IME4
MKFDIVLADPPWDFETWSDKGRDRSPDYPLMDLADIMMLPVKDITSDNSVLFLWCTNPFMPLVEAVMDRWGFKYSTKAFCWVKKNKVANTPFMGLGYWTRANPEDCWLGTKGSPKRRSKGVKQLVISRLGEHSSKPVVVKHRIVELMGDLPRIELFARDVTPGWHAIGYDVDGRDIRDSIHDYIE